MRIEVQRLFEKDIEKISDRKLANQVLAVINTLEQCNSLTEVKNLKKMKAKGDYYRIRVGNYRLGLKQNPGGLTLLRFLHRKDIYTYFP
ncbi:MAG: type II toxin-antitoxin system RelE/ParE family toxin [Chitinophagales bacterium]